ncbi:MAG: hypothetical protein ACI97A_000189 [Planctomycetota bacterium]|jgi:hypothetical protein
MSTDEKDIQLGLYLDGELPPDDLAALEGELATSPDLRDRLERLKRASKELQNFYTDSQMIDSPNETEKDIVIERIVRESTMQGRRSAINRKNGRRPSFILMTTVGITVIAALFLGFRTWMGGEPEASKLIEGARKELSSGYFEADVKMPSLMAVIQALSSAANQDILNAACRLRKGPDGIFNLQIKDKDKDEEVAQMGFDGVQGYLWRNGDTSVELLTLEEIKANPYVNAAFSSWELVRAALEEGIDHPDALNLVGKVKDAAAGSEQLWKVRLSGPSTSGRAKYWFDDEGQLRRIEAAGVQFDVNPKAKLTKKDFEISTVLPGKSIKRDL